MREERRYNTDWIQIGYRQDTDTSKDGRIRPRRMRMAKVRKNIILQGVSGKFAGQVVFRQLRDGRTILAAVPDFSQRVLSEAQKAHHAKVKAASAYAKVASKTQPIYAQLAAGTNKNAYNLAIADFFHAPVLHEVKQEGMLLKIQASDDVLVTRVSLTILGGDGTVLETGDAQPEEGTDRWTFLMRQAGRAVVEAYDLAGNVTRLEYEG